MKTTEEIPFAKLEKVMARLPSGTAERLDRVLRGGELRSHFIRNTLLAEILRREKEARK